MKRKSLILIPLISLFASLSLIGSAFAAWTSNGGGLDNQARVDIQEWDFREESDSAHYDRVNRDPSYLKLWEASSEENEEGEDDAILSDYSYSEKAIRLTNTNGTSGGAHSVNIKLYTGKDEQHDWYTLDEIRIRKIEFDYYHAEKRQQNGYGYPEVQLLSGNSGKGNTYGGGTTISPTAVYLSTDFGGGTWWHLEYFITALCPTFADHGDTGISLNTKIDGVKIIDKNVYDYTTTENGVTVDHTAFVIIDNLKLTATSSSRLGIFNRGTDFKVGNYYWFKIAWSGELQSVDVKFYELDGTTETTTYADYTPSSKSPFYLKGKAVGAFYATATLVVAGGQELSVTVRLTVST